MTDSPAIEIEGGGHWYRRGHWVFRGLAARLAPGETLCILGPNGRGKTTLLRALTGLLPLKEGTVRVRGGVAFVPQFFQTAFQYSVRDMVVMGRARHIGLLARPARADYAIAEAMLERVGLHGFAVRPFNALSGGERQLVLVARALAMQSDVLVLDEPASSLDLRNQAVLLKLLGEISAERGITVAYSTHHPQHALASGCKVLLMLEPDRQVLGDARTVLDEAHLAALYGVPVRRIELEGADGRGYPGLVPMYL